MTTSASTLIAQIIEKIGMPNGFAKLTPPERKFLLAAILGSMVPADGKVRSVEMEHLEDHLKKKYQMTSESLNQALAFASSGLAPEHLKQAAKHLPDLLGIEDRTNLVGMLWDLALCDRNLHSNEEKMIYNIAEDAGVTLKHVAEQKARAAGRIST